jgi:predicted pyridoxine 5'-phosphate oxidase superfamily flavin-nucleotide-binding protein
LAQEAKHKYQGKAWGWAGVCAWAAEGAKVKVVGVWGEEDDRIVWQKNKNNRKKEFSMAKLTQRIKEIFEKQETVVLATASKEGIPNVVPVNAKKILDDETILISDQFFNKTLSNMKDNPRVAITIWENFEKYQIKGTATIETSGKRFEETAKWIEDIGKHVNLPLKSKGAAIITITDIYNVSPGPNAGARVA